MCLSSASYVPDVNIMNDVRDTVHGQYTDMYLIIYIFHQENLYDSNWTYGDESFQKTDDTGTDNQTITKKKYTKHKTRDARLQLSLILVSYKYRSPATWLQSLLPTAICDPYSSAFVYVDLLLISTWTTAGDDAHHRIMPGDEIVWQWSSPSTLC